MSEYIILAISSLFLGAVIILGVYLKFGRGLATRIFAAIVPLCLLVLHVGYYIGAAGATARTMVPAFAFGISLGVPWLLLVYRSVVTRLDAQIRVLLRSTAEIAATATQAAATAAQQAATVAEVNATIEELRQTSAATAAAAQRVSLTAGEASRRGSEGIEAAGRAKAVLEMIAQVTELVESVREFADQSNMLAVNAGIEAAKAGEQGRGFSVVAAEVRALAEQSKLAAQRIRSSLSGAEDGKRALAEVDATLARLAATLEESTDRSNQIAATAAQEAAGVAQIAMAMSNVADGGASSAAAARQLEDAIRSVNHVTEDLQRFVAG
jgi:methyl-accepting chemotaxis protein